MFISLPEAGHDYGFGHITRQCVFINLLRKFGLEAYLTLPNNLIGKKDIVGKLLSGRLEKKYLLSYHEVKYIITSRRVDIKLIIDSYDYKSNLRAIDIKPSQLIIFDDLAFDKNYTDDIFLIIPNECLPEQIKRMQGNSAKDFLYGKNTLLIPHEFLKPEEDRLALAKTKMNRLKEVAKGKKKLKVIIGFGRSIKYENHYQDILQHKIKILSKNVSQMEILCLGQVNSKIIEKLGIKYECLDWLNPREMSNLYSKSDMYIGPIGYSMWERASMLVPSFVLPIVDNQLPYLRVGEELGIHRHISTIDRDWYLSASDLLRGSIKNKFSNKAYDLFGVSEKWIV